MKRLFIVVNPSQYLNAVEFAYSQEHMENTMFVMTPYPKGIQELDKIGANTFWSDFEILQIGGPNKFKSDYEFYNACKKKLIEIFEKQHFDELVLGNLIDGNIYPFILKNKKRIPKIIVLDDGTPTLNVVHQRNKRKLYWTYHFRSFRILAKNVFYLGIFPPLFSPPRNLTYFSLFDFPVLKGDRRLSNDYAWTKSKIKGDNTTSEVFFIGSHIVDRRLVSEQSFLDSIATVRDDVKKLGKELTYIHHRGESKHIKDKIKSICPTIEFDIPLELAFLERPGPYMFVGHFSTALFTLSRIYSTSKVMAYLFPDNLIRGTEYESKKYVLRVQDAIVKDNRIDFKYLKSNI